MPYASDVTPEQAWEALTSDPDAVLVDVRTTAEWTYVGIPDVSELGKQTHLVEWVTFPEGVPNGAFVDQLRSAGIAQGTNVYFLCRSGVRSVAAAEAATAAGLGPAHNVLDGFEGNPDGRGRRGTISGWKFAGLPWHQQ